MTQKKQAMYDKKKRRIFGEILTPAETTSPNAWLAIHRSSKELLITYESSGLVVSINGGGSTETDHPHVAQATEVVTGILDRGGIVMSGGRTTGVMSATAQTPKGRSVGIIFPELKSEAQEGLVAVVNSPNPRIELLGTCPPVIIVFRGGLGTFTVLMRAIIHLKNRQYHPEQLPQLLFVSDYWVGLLSTMVNMGTLPKEFITGITFFHDTATILKKIPTR